MKSQGNKTRDNLRCKEWERQRRDRLCEAFKGLAQLLPNHDPSKDPPKITILDKATQFIKDLRLSNSRLLTQQTQTDETSTKIKELQDEVNKLILRLRQLTRLLNQAKIPIPMGPFIKSLGKKPKKWTNQLTLEDLENTRRVQIVQNSETHSLNQKVGESTEKGTPKETENRLTAVPTSIVIPSPLKEANSGEVLNGNLEKSSVDQGKTPDPPPTSATSARVVPVAIQSASPEKLPVENPTIIRTANPPLIIQQPTTIPNISFPLQTSYILTRFPTQQPLLTQFTIGPNPRLILRKPPTSSPGDIPKVAIPCLRREAKVVKKRAKRQPKPKLKNVILAKSTEAGKPTLSEVAIIADPNSKPSAETELETETSLLSNSNTSPEPQPILVDISGPIESEIESSEEQIKITETSASTADPVLEISTVDSKIPETNELVKDNSTEVVTSQQNEPDIVEEMDTSTISKDVLIQNPPLEVESSTLTTETAQTTTSIEKNTPSDILLSESSKNAEVEDVCPILAIAPPTEGKLPLPINTLEKVPSEPKPQSNVQKEILESTTKNQFLHLKTNSMENFDNISGAMEESDETQETESCINDDKISECIARSIDLIDHPEAELMELGADWGVVGVGESHSPKSPISPTQMFLSMFPLLPRESIVTAAVGVEHEQGSTPNSVLKNSNSNSTSHFCSISGRSSFFIDSMLPEQGHPQVSGPVAGTARLAMTPITQSCLQQNYPSPPSFQSLANVVSSSHNLSSSGTVIPMKSPLTTVASSVPSSFFQNTSTSTTEVSSHSKIRPSPTASSGNYTAVASVSSYSSCITLPSTGSTGTGTTAATSTGSGTGSQKRSYQQHVTSTQQFYPPEIPRVPLPPTSNSAAHSISQLFNPFVNNQRRRQSTQMSFNDNYSYYPQEPLCTPQNPVAVHNLNKYSVQNNNSRLDCVSHNQQQQQTSDDPRNRRHPPVPESRSQPQPAIGVAGCGSAIFRPASNVFNQTGNNLTTTIPPTPSKHTDSSEKQQRSNVPNKVVAAAPHNPNSNPNTMDYRNTSQTQAFSHPQYAAQPSQNAGRHSQYQIQGVPDPTFNFMSNPSHQRPETISGAGTVQNPSHFENKNLTPRSFPRSANANTPAKQTSIRSTSNTEFNADFLAYSSQPTPSQSQTYQGNNRQPSAHCPYDISTAPSITSEKSPYRASAPMQQQSHTLASVSKVRQPPFYLPDPPPIPIPSQSQPHYESTNLLPNYSNQQPIRQPQSQQSHYSNNFVPQFYNNRVATSANTSGNKEYQFSNPHSQNITKPTTSDFYQNHSTLTPLPPQEHQQQLQSVEPPTLGPGPPNSKKPTAPLITPPNFGANSQQSTINQGTGNSGVLNQNQSQTPQISSRPVNWMTDPQPVPHKKSSSISSSGHSTTNPFSVSKLVGNNSNNYCTEALIRKNPNPDWNDFHCFLPPPPPTTSTLQLPSQSVTFSPQSQLQPQPPIARNEYLPYNPYHTNTTNFGNFDPHNFQHHYNISNEMNNTSQNHGQGQGQNHGGSNILSHGAGGTNTSVSNFNLSSIFPEMNDKRGNNHTSGPNCGYYGSNNGIGK